MFNRFKYNKSAKYILIAVAILAVSIIATILGTNHSKELNLYQGEHEVVKYTESETEEETDAPTDMEIKTPFDIKMSIGIPVGWFSASDGNTCSYVHKESGAAIKLELLDYDPNINSINEAQAANQTVAKGYTYVGFIRTSETSYELYYSDSGVNTYDYMEETFWDREHIVKITFICNDMHYDRMQKTFTDCFATFQWDREDPIVPGLYLAYDQNLLYEIGIPSEWYVSTADTSLFAQDAYGSVSMMVTPLDFTGTVESITTDDISYLLNPNSSKPNMVLLNYTVEDGRGYVVSSYINNNTKFQERSLLYVNNGLLVIETFTYIPGTIDETMIDECFRLVRGFRDGLTEEELNTEPETTISEMANNFEQSVKDMTPAEPENNGTNKDTGALNDVADMFRNSQTPAEETESVQEQSDTEPEVTITEEPET